MRSRPLVLFDADCRFCRRWIERWRAITGERVDYRPSDEAKSESLQWIAPDGTQCAGAEAVFRVLATSTWTGAVLLWLFTRIPPFAWLANFGYRFVAKQRAVFSFFTSLLWGPDLRPPAYAISAFVFVRLLGIIYLIAFVSYWVQIDGLIGKEGILPAATFFEKVHEAYGNQAYWELPSLCWLGASDSTLYLWCGAGIAASLLVAAGILPMPCLLFLWIDYLSLSIAGQVFYQFQWDILLLETGFLAMFLSPLTPWWRRSSKPPRAARLLCIWLLIRLMVASGVVKLSSGDYTWTHGLALQFHYYTQPLPTPLAWYAHQLPDWFQSFSVWVMFAIEIGTPWLLLGPRRLRLLGAGAILFLQLLILLTGNYGFFNLLTIALCLLAIDDGTWCRLVGRKRDLSKASYRFLPKLVLIPVAIVLFLLSLPPFWSAFRIKAPILRPLYGAYDKITPFRTINSYGLFQVMTTTRLEIKIQGSDDQVVWKDYVFRYKPGDPHRPPPWVAPHMPRLDWQMWFAALGSVQNNPWFMHLAEKLLRGSRPVSELFAVNPFPEKPPKYIRALADDYTFTTYGERKESGEWWKVQSRTPYCPPLSLRE